MKAVTFQGINEVQVQNTPDPRILKPDDIIIQVTSTGICGSDLHFYHGMIPSMGKGYILGHETMGVVLETGPDVHKVKRGDRVAIPFNVACGHCRFCEAELESQCDLANPEGEMGAVYGCSRLFGDYAGGQAELLRVPYANYLPMVIPPGCEVEEDTLLLMTDALPTSLWGVIQSGMKQGDTVVVLGCGPIGLLTQKWAWRLGASRVIAVDYVPYRLEHARKANRVETVNFLEQPRTGEYLREITNGGADVVIDCVGGDGKMSFIEKVETALRLQGGGMSAINIASQAVRKGGTVELVGFYGLRYNAFPLGDFFGRSVSLRMGTASVVHLMGRIYEELSSGFDPSDIITHRLPLSSAAHAYEIFDKKKEDAVKIILKP
ncbi:alcohol dehydrogenase catalytic domain-containing protein [Paenibacillus silviterrae]|uniref:alcohol dehydrogenase catalytic domain-containing protein n=1 Tax=Paenibacillus silviterrae TaxID=3242194 RepID=UPI00254361E7|nr:alcohol dehydrogenase catalytic domain-containing protein [Paenibacillus chinjuensis]